jgi:hypothetical protein
MMAFGWYINTPRVRQFETDFSQQISKPLIFPLLLLSASTAVCPLYSVSLRHPFFLLCHFQIVPPTMRLLPHLTACFGFLLSSFVTAAPYEVSAGLAPRQSQNCNTATNRACWISGSNGFNINTDYEANTPTTGVTVPVRQDLFFLATQNAITRQQGCLVDSFN